jgi:hypothetical protein
MPAPGTLVTESEALRHLLLLVRTSTALLGTFHEQLRQNRDDETYITVTDLILQIQESALALLNAWDAAQHPEEEDDEDDEDDDL